MNPRSLAIPLRLVRYLWVGYLWVGSLWVGPVWAGPYKCVQPDGSVIYQETLCALDAAGAELTLDPAGPSRGSKGRVRDYSVEGQLKALEADRKKAQRARAKGLPETARARKNGPGYDRAKCAKNRAEAARWRHAARSSYRDRDERDYREQKLQYHQALVDQYCAPD